MEMKIRNSRTKGGRITGFRKRMSTRGGRKVIKRQRAKRLRG